EHLVSEPLNGENGLQSVPALFRRNAKNNPSAPAYREKEFGIWQTWTWTDAASEAEALALGLIDLGIKQGDFVAIIGRNRPSLYISMVGI
ncbi:AMP-binding protein, partial [Klebsiella pneumoniae]|uniref:AMP-binding protein n=1 Tax=Klebsiella pneumoniae TaxID=573 RepID=UPI0039C02BCC